MGAVPGGADLGDADGFGAGDLEPDGFDPLWLEDRGDLTLSVL